MFIMKRFNKNAIEVRLTQSPLFSSNNDLAITTFQISYGNNQQIIQNLMWNGFFSKQLLFSFSCVFESVCSSWIIRRPFVPAQAHRPVARHPRQGQPVVESSLQVWVCLGQDSRCFPNSETKCSEVVIYVLTHRH